MAQMQVTKLAPASFKTYTHKFQNLMTNLGPIRQSRLIFSIHSPKGLFLLYLPPLDRLPRMKWKLEAASVLSIANHRTKKCMLHIQNQDIWVVREKWRYFSLSILVSKIATEMLWLYMYIWSFLGYQDQIKMSDINGCKPWLTITG